MENESSGRVALVTGASRGIGRSIAEVLASTGATVICNYSSSPQAAEETTALCEKAGGRGVAMKFNVGSSEEVDGAFEEIKSKFGKLDVLVNNAGISKDGLILRMKDEDWLATLGINLNGTFYCSRAASKMMLKARSGRIVNISSVVGEMGNAGQAPYVSSKAGVIGLTKSMARELASRSITVNCVTPGFIETDMTHGLDEKLKEEHLKAIPLGRYGQAKEVADLVAFLVSDSAQYITGQIIGINGGMYM